MILLSSILPSFFLPSQPCFPRLLRNPPNNPWLWSLGCPHTTSTSLNPEISMKWNSIHVTTPRFTNTPSRLRLNQSSLYYDTQHFMSWFLSCSSPCYPLYHTLSDQTVCVIVFHVISLHILFTKCPPKLLTWQTLGFSLRFHSKQ